MWRIVATVSVGAALAAWAFPRAIEDWQFQLAGLADPFLGRPAPGLTILVGVVASAIVGSIVLVVGRTNRPAALRSGWAWPLLAGWLAYGLGAAITLAGGGQAAYPGTLRYDFGEQGQHETTGPAGCRTPVGKPTVLAEVRPTVGNGTPAVGGLPMLWLREAATGAPERFGPLTEPLISGAGDGTALAAFVVPTLPGRVLPFLEMTHGDGTVTSEVPIEFLRAYDYVVIDLDDRGLSGEATVRATRWEDPYGGDGLRWVNLTIPNDPWPESFELSIGWSCDR